MSGGSVAPSSGYAPASAVIRTRRPVIVPSRRAPSSTSCTWARPWVMTVMLSVRVSTYRTGRAEPERERTDRHLLRVGRDLRAEPAADLRRDDADLRLLEAEDPRDRLPRGEGRLHGQPHREPARVRVGDGERAVRLHGGRRQPLVDEPCPDHDLRVLQRAGVGGHRVLDGRVAPVLREQHGGVRLERADGVDDRGERVVLDEDRLGRVHGVRPGIGHDHRDRLADEAHDAVGQDRTSERLRDVLDLVHRRESEVGARQHTDDARHPARLLGRDAEEARVRDEGSDEDGVEPSFGREVVQEPRGAREESGILDPQDRVPQDRPRPEVDPRLSLLISFLWAHRRPAPSASRPPAPCRPVARRRRAPPAASSCRGAPRKQPWRPPPRSSGRTPPAGGS